MAKLIFAFVIVGLLGTICDAQVPTFLKTATANLRRECMKETGVPEEMIENAGKGIFVEDNRLKCYFKCALTEIGLIDEEGNFNYELALGLLPEAFKEVGQKIANDCRGITGTDLCDKAFKMNKCAYMSNPEAYFVI